jgi:hypothetical protein
MTAKGDEWVAEVPMKEFIAGEHVVTVQATLADGRAYQKPLPVKVDLPGGPKAIWMGNLGGAIQSSSSVRMTSCTSRRWAATSSASTRAAATRSGA